MADIHDESLWSPQRTLAQIAHDEHQAWAQLQGQTPQPVAPLTVTHRTDVSGAVAWSSRQMR